MPEVRQPADQAQREVALDIQRSFIVEAPAGSGKTNLLIQRFLKLLTDPYVLEPEQVLAITFTRKATAEMRDRVLKMLERAETGPEARNESERQTLEFAEEVLRRDVALGWRLLEQPQRLNIRTIDSVCAEVARSLPQLAGGVAGLTPMDDATGLYREAAGRVIAELGDEDAELNDALRTVLLHRDGNLADCQALLAEMLAWREQWGRLIPLGQQLSEQRLEAEVRPKLERALQHIVCSSLTRLADALGAELANELALIASAFGRMPGYKEAENPLVICAELRVAPGAAEEHLEHWQTMAWMLVTDEGKKWRSAKFNRGHLKIDFDKVAQVRLITLLERLDGKDDLLEAIRDVCLLPPAMYPKDQWRVAKALFRLLNRALAELKVLFAERGECDFTEMALAARIAFQNDPEAAGGALGLEMRLQHLLVDEMQDTSSGQYELLEALTTGWDGRSQTVFFVGDPKQSIYLFRQARVERFLGALESGRLGEIELVPLRLTANFRSQATLVEQFNETFKLIFPAEAVHPEDVTFTAASAEIEASEHRGMVWRAHQLESTSRDGGAERSRQARRDARGIRQVIEEWRDQPLPPGRTEPWKIGVLVRNRAHLQEVVAELREGAIPYRAVEIEPLAERLEVLDLLAITRALLHPADRVGWLAVLRSPMCGLSLRSLHLLTGSDDATFAKRTMVELIEERAGLLDENEQARLLRVWEVMRMAMAERGRYALSQLVERTWISLGGDLCVGLDERQNVEAYLELLDGLEEVSVTEIERQMERLYAKPSAAKGAIELLTIHKSKGLEWDLVVIPGLERKGRASGSRLLDWLELVDEEMVLLAPIAGKGDKAGSLNAWIRKINNQREAAERKRLFYVGCTRAREELHLYATTNTTTDGEVNFASDSLLAVAWPAAEAAFAPPQMAEVISFPKRDEEQVGLELAAVAEPLRMPAAVRLPMEINPRERFVREDASAAAREGGRPMFERPQGGLEARAFGNCVHALVEALAAAGNDADVSGWSGRANALLRAQGLSPRAVRSMTPRVIRGLEKMVADEVGRWLLAPHAGAASEYGLQTEEATLRIDRHFFAGMEPMADGEGCLWIIDFKSGEFGGLDVEEFLNGQAESYRPQMEAYARAKLAELGGVVPVRLGLYFPLLPRLTWWEFE